MIAFTFYIASVIGAICPFLCMTDKGRKLWAIGAATVWPLLVLFVVGCLVYEEITNWGNV